MNQAHAPEDMRSEENLKRNIEQGILESPESDDVIKHKKRKAHI